MKYAFYLGCATPIKALKYEISARNLAKRLGIELVDVPEFSCCGFPAKSMDSFAAFLMAARNLVLAEERGMDIIGLCTGCMAALSEAKECLNDERLRDRVNEKLRPLGVKGYNGRVKVKHFARFLYEDYGLAAVKEKIVAPLESLNFGVHYGCHYTKPSHAHRHFEDPSHPTTLDELIRSAGARTIEYPNKNLCCGMTVMGAAEDLSFRLASEKLECLSRRGVDAMVVACPSCCIAYENNQKLAGKKTGKEFNLPVLYFTQVIGLAAGLTEEDLGFEFNRIKFKSALSSRSAK
jgi:heterodisulfide reductase subunit B